MYQRNIHGRTNEARNVFLNARNRPAAAYKTPWPSISAIVGAMLEDDRRQQEAEGVQWQSRVRLSEVRGEDWQPFQITRDTRDWYEFELNECGL